MPLYFISARDTCAILQSRCCANGVCLRRESVGFILGTVCSRGSAAALSWMETVLLMLMSHEGLMNPVLFVTASQIVYCRLKIT